MFGFVPVLLNICSASNLLRSRRLRPDSMPAFDLSRDFLIKFLRSTSCLLLTTFVASFLCLRKKVFMIFRAAATVHPRPTHPAKSFGAAGSPSCSQLWSKALRYHSSSKADKAATRPDEMMSFGYQRYAGDDGSRAISLKTAPIERLCTLHPTHGVATFHLVRILATNISLDRCFQDFPLRRDR